MEDWASEHRLNNDDAKESYIQFPVMDKGRDDEDMWDEIRHALVERGEQIYNACMSWKETDDHLTDEEE